MTKRHSHDSASASPPQAKDNLQLIAGIGPAVEKRLHAAQVYTFAQLAKMTPAGLAQVLAGSGVTANRIIQGDWIGKAREHAGLPAADEESELVYRQHYASFTVRLLLNEDNQVRRTEVKHVQSNDDESWGGWDESMLVHYFAERASIRLPPPAQVADEVHAPLVDMSHVPPLAVAVGDITLDEAGSEGPSGAITTDRRLRAHVPFNVVGSDAEAFVASQAGFTVIVLARELTTKQTTMLSMAERGLTPGQLGYEPSVEFDLPPVGRYLILGAVLLPGEGIASMGQGPAFRVVP